MSRNLEYLRKVVGNDAIRCSADGVSCAVAATAGELVVARAGGLGTEGKLERFSLRELAAVRILPNPHANMFEAQFADGKAARMMYHRETVGRVERLHRILEELIARSGSDAVADEPLAAMPPEVEESLAAAGPSAAAVRSPDDERAARMNRIILVLIVLPLVLLYVYSTYSR
jgi:hypothetical protein